jgi:WD40 repeat protein
MKSCGPIPFISPWLYRQKIRKLARCAADGDVPAVQELAGLFCTENDPRVRFLAGQGLRALISPEQVDLLCREVILRDNKDLSDRVQEWGYLPSTLPERALFLYCTSRCEELCQIDGEENHPRLAAGYAAAAETIRLRARSVSRTNGTCPVLARALAGISCTQHAGNWSYGEWEVVLEGFTREERWDDLWRLAILAPLPLAVTAITALKDTGWMPPGDEQVLWRDVITTLPEQWTYPIPAGQNRPPAGRPAGQVTRLCFSGDGSLLATGCSDGLVQVWRTASAGLVAEFSDDEGSIRFLALSADNTCILSSGHGRNVHSRSLVNNNKRWSWEIPAGATVLAILADNRILHVGDDRGNLHSIDADTGQLLRTISHHQSSVSCLACHQDSFAAGYADGTISWVPDDGGDNLRIMPGNGDPVRSLTFSTSGTECLAVYETALPALWNMAAGAKIRGFFGHKGRTICIAASAEGRWCAIGSDEHTLRTWNWDQPMPVAVIPLYNRRITCCSTAPGESLLATGFQDGSLRMYSMPDARLVREYKGHKKTISSCAIAPDGTRLATISWDGTTKLWRLPGGEILRTLNSHAGGIASLAGPSGTLIATVTDDGIARVLEGSDGSLIRTIDLYTPQVRAAALSADGTYLASAGANATLRIWNTRDGSLVAASEHLATSQRCCTFLPDGTSLFTGGWDGSCRLFRIPDGKLTRTLRGHTSIVTCCTVSKDGSLLVTGSNDTTVRLWRVTGGESYATLSESQTEVSAVALTPDRTLLAAGGSDGMIRLYRLPYGTLPGELPQLPGKVTSLTFTHDSTILVAGYDAGTCAYISLHEKKIIHTVPSHTGAITGMGILPDKKTLVTTGADGMCRFSPLPHTPILSGASLFEISAIEREETISRKKPDNAQWAFLRTLLAARFRDEVGICPSGETAGWYDIQIAG